VVAIGLPITHRNLTHAFRDPEVASGHFSLATRLPMPESAAVIADERICPAALSFNRAQRQPLIHRVYLSSQAIYGLSPNCLHSDDDQHLVHRIFGPFGGAPKYPLAPSIDTPIFPMAVSYDSQQPTSLRIVDESDELSFSIIFPEHLLIQYDMVDEELTAELHPPPVVFVDGYKSHSNIPRNQRLERVSVSDAVAKYTLRCALFANWQTHINIKL
jgi:hypothetical protein